MDISATPLSSEASTVSASSVTVVITPSNGNVPLFSLGALYITPGALEVLNESGQAPLPYLLRHASGDWGELDAHDKAANDEALRQGQRLLSAYQVTSLGAEAGTKSGTTSTTVWIITEWDRSSTTVLLPEEY